MLRYVLVFIAVLVAGPAQSTTMNLSGSADDLLSAYPLATISGFVEFTDPIPAGDGAIALDDWSIVIGGNTLIPTSSSYSVNPFINVTGGTISGLGFTFDGAASLFGATVVSLVADGLGGLSIFDDLFMPLGFGDFQLVPEMTSTVPLPASLPLFLTGIAGLAWLGNRRRAALTKQA